MQLAEFHQQQGGVVAPDGIPLHFGDQTAEYRAIFDSAVLLDRSHEGRLALNGRDRFELMQRMSTNDLLNMGAGEGRATVFTDPNARIIDRVMVYNRDSQALVITEPGRGAAVQTYLQRNIFFNDDVQVAPFNDSTQHLALHGAQADTIVGKLVEAALELPPLHGIEAQIDGVHVFLARNKPLHGTHWTMIAPANGAVAVWGALTEAGASAAGSLTYNVLRIQSGRPGIGRELSRDYIPLEVGLWDEISFSKGCYTGQEIIARMESRNRLAKVMVTLELDAAVNAPADIIDADRSVGKLTSSVTTPDGAHIGIGVIKIAQAHTGQTVVVGESSVTATVTGLAAVPPPMAQQS